MQFLTGSGGRLSKISKYAKIINIRKLSSLPETVVDSEPTAEYVVKATQVSYEKRINKFVQLPNVPFRVLVIPGFTELPETQETAEKRSVEELDLFSDKMKVNSTEWEHVWNYPKPFNWSMVPLPVRQGYVKHPETTLPPSRVANVEITKISNFLHLTPRHVEKQCEELRAFCTEFPEKLKNEKFRNEHFPINVISSNFCHSGPSIRHEKSSNVKIKFPLKSLKLNKDTREKFIRLCDGRFNKTDDSVTLFSDRCPTKKQNYDYLSYIMNVLIYESSKKDKFEHLMVEDDQMEYIWENKKSKHIIETFISNINTSKEKKVVLMEEYKTAAQNLRKSLNQESMERYKLAASKLLYHKVFPLDDHESVGECSKSLVS